MENVIIIGGGIAGLTAAIYAARAKLNPLVISGVEEGGQLMLTTEVENYPGFPEGIQGPELIENMKQQAKRFGARFLAEDVKDFSLAGKSYKLKIGEKEVETKSVIVASGASAKWLGLESEKKYTGRGVSSCATCDAYFFGGKDVIVVGGGDSACEEALFLTKFANKVFIVHRRDKLRASKIMQERTLKNEKISILWDSEIEAILGDESKVTGAKLKNLKTGKQTEMKIDGVFIAIGHLPNTKVFAGKLVLDSKGYLISDRRMRTNLPGVFAAGDVQDTLYRQAVTAAGSGCQAAIESERYLESLH